MVVPQWFPNWSKNICAVVASGESASSAGVELLQGIARVIAVNNSHQLVPFADALYADGKWWDNNPQALAFKGLKITANEATASRLRLKRIQIAGETEPHAHEMCIDHPGLIGHGGHSGFKALNLAVQFGGRRIALIGFDYQGKHWHPDHELPLHNPRQAAMDKWRDRLDAQAVWFEKNGIVVVNCSEQSALTAYRKVSFEQILAEWAVTDDRAR